MDNKKWYKRITTCFWFLLASMPIWLTAIQCILIYLIHTDSLSLTDIQSFISSIDYSNYLTNNSNLFISYTPTFITNMWTSVFNSIGGITDNAFALCFSWFTWVYLIHVLLDVAIWLPKMFHSWLDRWC